MAPALAARRASDVLRHLARHPDRPLTLSELAEALDVAPAALHGVLLALTDAALVDREPEGKRYRLGPEAVLVGAAARSQRPEYAEALRVAADMAADHGVDTIGVARRGDDLVALDGVGDVWRPDRGALGAYRVLGAPRGACFVAGAKHQHVLAWMSRGGIAAESDQAEELRLELDRIADRGWALQRPPERGLDTVVMAALPAPAQELPMAAVACHVPDGSTLDPTTLGADLAARVRAAASTLPPAG